MPTAPQETSYQDRLVALKLLRENMFYNDPKTYAFTDIAEDLPGDARAIAPIFKNVLPSAAIISRDPAERDKQIDAAIRRIKESKKSKSKLLEEMQHNVTHLTPEAIKGGLLFSALPTLLGLRAPWTRNAAGSLRPQIPMAPIAAIKKLLSSKSHIREIPAGRSAAFQAHRQARQAKVAPRRHMNHLKNTVKDIAHGGLYAGTYAAGAGALVPLFAGNYELSDNALQEAKEIMQKNPYITSLPASEMLSAIRQHKSESPLSGEQRVKNTLLGAGLGAATSLPGALIPAALSGVGRLATNVLGRVSSKMPNIGGAKINSFLQRHANSSPLSRGIKDTILNRFKSDVPSALKWGTGLGAISGVLSSNNPVVDEYENLGPN
jgi:hypothetical protein